MNGSNLKLKATPTKNSYVVTINTTGTFGSDNSVTVTVSGMPVADAGNDQRVALGAHVTLDGTGSTDPDGDTITYSWEKPSGSTITLNGATTASPTFTAPSTAGDLIFTLTVTAGGLSSTDVVTVTVSAPPTANAGSDQAVALNSSVTLDGSASSDPDGDDLSYSWVKTAGSDVSPSGANTTNPTFTAPSATETLKFSLTVSDGPNSVTDSVTIVVSGMPIADAGPAQKVARNSTVTLDGSGSTDPDGDTISYSWVQTSGNTVNLSSAIIANPTFTAPDVSEDLVFTLTVTAGGLSSTDTVTVTVSQPPVANAGTDQRVAPSSTISLDGSGSSDPDGETLSYSWEKPTGSSVTLSDSSTESPTFTAPATAGSLTFTLTVTAGGLSSTDDVTVTVSTAPTANAGNDQAVALSSSVTLNGSGSDPENDSLTYSWATTSGGTGCLLYTSPSPRDS